MGERTVLAMGFSLTRFFKPPFHCLHPTLFCLFQLFFLSKFKGYFPKGLNKESDKTSRFYLPVLPFYLPVSPRLFFF